MIKKVLVSVLFTLLLMSKVQPQSVMSDTVKFESLPDTLKNSIYNNISALTEKDTVIGSFSFNRNNINRRYTYKVYINNGQLFGFYTYYRDCQNCITSHDFAYIKANAIYCCKDPNHKTKETAKTKSEILAIKQKNKCAKVGVCIY